MPLHSPWRMEGRGPRPLRVRKEGAVPAARAAEVPANAEAVPPAVGGGGPAMGAPSRPPAGARARPVTPPPSALEPRGARWRWRGIRLARHSGRASAKTTGERRPGKGKTRPTRGGPRRDRSAKQQSANTDEKAKVAGEAMDNAPSHHGAAKAGGMSSASGEGKRIRAPWCRVGLMVDVFMS